MTIFQQKTALRQKVKLLLNLLTAEEVAVKSAAVWAQVERLQEFKSAKNILAYASLKTEVQTHDFLQRWSGKKSIFLPIVCGDELRVGRFCHAECNEASLEILRFAQNDKRGAQNDNSGILRRGAFGILQPETALAEIPPLDLAIIPGIAFDRRNNRLGRGKGFYDNFLKHKVLQKIGVCFDCQLFDEIPHEEFDVRMDKVVTNG